MTEIDYAALVQQSPDAAILADREGKILVWNTTAERIFGFSAAEAIGQTLDIIVPEAFRERHWTGYDRALAAGETKYVGQWLPTRSMKADGTEIYVELGFAMIHDASGAVTAVLGTARDITERFTRDRAERRRVRDLEAELAALKEGAPER
jgi:PAS domain S-box-containing protein